MHFFAAPASLSAPHSLSDRHVWNDCELAPV
jgi:hypothetical protein